MKITLFTSGSTGKQKRVTHDMRDFYKAGHWLVEKWEIDHRDVILNPFPSWTVACWAFCIIPAKITHCDIVNIKMQPLKFWDVVEEVKPKIIVTSNDIDITFYNIKNFLKEDIKTISIQRCARESKEFKNFNNYKKKLIADYVLLFSMNRKKFYRKYIKAKYLEIGSFRNNFYKKKNKTNKKLILLISQFLEQFCVNFCDNMLISVQNCDNIAISKSA